MNNAIEHAIIQHAKTHVRTEHTEECISVLTPITAIFKAIALNSTEGQLKEFAALTKLAATSPGTDIDLARLNIALNVFFTNMIDRRANGDLS